MIANDDGIRRRAEERIYASDGKTFIREWIKNQRDALRWQTMQAERKRVTRKIKGQLFVGGYPRESYWPTNSDMDALIKAKQVNK